MTDYATTLDAAFCHTCVLAVKMCKAQLSGNLCDSVFMFGGFPTGKMPQLDIRNISAPHTRALQFL